MQIETIRLRDFRNYHSLILTPHPGVNILLGQNGSGKTNLLEAVHYCALGRSHRTGLDREVVRKGAMMAASGVTLRKKAENRNCGKINAIRSAKKRFLLTASAQNAFQR